MQRSKGLTPDAPPRPAAEGGGGLNRVCLVGLAKLRYTDIHSHYMCNSGQTQSFAGKAPENRNNVSGRNTAVQLVPLAAQGLQWADLQTLSNAEHQTDKYPLRTAAGTPDEITSTLNSGRNPGDEKQN
ncbi:hypothetical protein DPX16_19543 [Anabarilius grahami]|uniref:Uncharacterized protein n=1 Tax=Anabarilius grahami TaxID=495550 RepID=A0A3N0Y7A6_ANAGA|nr:hypothetical protein DPX16_19543 [Anabarilius grahami]